MCKEEEEEEQQVEQEEEEEQEAGGRGEDQHCNGIQTYTTCVYRGMAYRDTHVVAVHS